PLPSDSRSMYVPTRGALGPLLSQNRVDLPTSFQSTSILVPNNDVDTISPGVWKVRIADSEYKETESSLAGTRIKIEVSTKSVYTPAPLRGVLRLHLHFAFGDPQSLEFKESFQSVIDAFSQIGIAVIADSNTISSAFANISVFSKATQ